MCEIEYIWNPDKCSCENGKYLGNIVDDSVIMGDEIMDAETKTVPSNFNEKNINCKTQNLYILLAFLLTTMALLIAVNIFCYLIKYWAKQKYLLPFPVKNNELREVLQIWIGIMK